MLAVTASERPFAHLLPGSDALTPVREKLSDLSWETDDWEALTPSTDD